MWPLYGIMQNDYISKWAITYRKLNWHVVPRRNMGSWLGRLYQRSQQTNFGKTCWAQMDIIMPPLCDITSAILFKGVQLMVLTMASRVVSLLLLFRTTKWASYVDEYNLYRPSRCGLNEGWYNLYLADSSMALLDMLLWFLVLCIPMCCFFVPMLFASRYKEDWHSATIFSTITKPDIKNKRLAYMLPTGGAQNAFLYHAVKARESWLPYWCCGVRHSWTRLCDTLRCVCTFNLKFVYKFVLVPLPPTEMRYTFCWPDIRWLSDCRFSLFTCQHICGIFVDFFTNICCMMPLAAGLQGTLLTRYGTKSRVLPTPRGAGLIELRHWLGFGLFTVVFAYLHLIWAAISTSLKRLVLMTCGFWTEELLTSYNMFRRAADIDPARTEARSYHEQIAFTTGRSHGLYWLFIPGLGILTKMCEYLNEKPTWFVLGNQLKEILNSNGYLTVRYRFGPSDDGKVSKQDYDAMPEGHRCMFTDEKGDETGEFVLLDAVENGHGERCKFEIYDESAEVEKKRRIALAKKEYEDLDGTEVHFEPGESPLVGLDLDLNVENNLCFVEHVYQGSQAARWLQPGDVINSIDGHTIGGDLRKAYKLLSSRRLLKSLRYLRPKVNADFPDEKVYEHSELTQWKKYATALEQVLLFKEEGVQVLIGSSSLLCSLLTTHLLPSHYACGHHLLPRQPARPVLHQEHLGGLNSPPDQPACGRCDSCHRD